MKKKVKVSAPGKLMLFGEHAVVYGYPCIVTAVDQRIEVTVETVDKDILEINAPDVGFGAYVKRLNSLSKGENVPKEVVFVETAVRNFLEQYPVKTGFRITTKSQFSSQFGFGSSSAVTVGVIATLNSLFGKQLNKKQIFDMCYKTVLDVQGVGSGFDLAAAIWGGTLYFVGGGKRIIPIRMSRRLPFIVGYTGIKADTPTLVRQVGELYKSNRRVIGKIFDATNLLVDEAKKDLNSGDMERLGELMNINQGLLDALGVSSQELDSLISAAREKGAYGAKLSGAGGGDCMIAICATSKKSLVESAINTAGGTVLRVETNAQGMQIENES